MTRISVRIQSLVTSTAIAALAHGAAYAQDASADASAEGEDENRIVVIGTQIQGAQINDVLPVTVLDETVIENTGASSGDELFRSIPQAGVVAFNDQNTTGGVNGARGDVGSINLRELGTGNTLMLINGRRMVLHPGFQTELLVPVVSADANEISPGSVRRVEVLRDGASAIYGADAVAGVINTTLKGGMKGGFLEGDWRASDGTSLYSYTLSGGYGFDFGDGRGNLTVYGGYFHENGMPASERDYARSDDRTALLEGTDFEGDSQFNNLISTTPWGQFDIQVTTNNNQTPIRDDDFFLQPDTESGCRLDFGNGICARNGTIAPLAQRYNTNFGADLFSEKTRYNALALFSYEISPSVEFYAEGSFYRSENRRNIEATAILSTVPVGMARDGYWNPFGPATSPNRLPGLTNVPAEGLDVILERFRFIDVGNRDVSVDKNVYRFVGGFKGNFGNWDFDTGFVYSKARLTDFTSNRISLTKLQESISRPTSDSYNLFNGGCLDNINEGDCTPNPQSVIDDITVGVYRKGGTSLALADFKISRDDLFQLPGGDLGIAAGVEWRRETFFDDRDPRLDGTITFTDSVTGDFNGSDIVGSSPSPDTSGSRVVFSAFTELFVPIINEDMGIPLVHDFNVQLAGRAEHFKDIDETTVVPRAAASWTVTPGLLLRGAWSKGFRAPNLVQVNDEGTTRTNSRVDYVLCQAEVENGDEPDLGSCGSTGTVSFRFGTENLQPEKSESINLGVVLEPGFIPGLTLTADYWRVTQNGIVGVFGDDNAIALDLLRRLNGSTNPNVIRAAPTADQIAYYSTTSLAPAGDVIQVLDEYRNLDSRRSKGWDFGMFYRVPDFGLGDFRLRFNAARLNSFVQSAGPDGQELLDAIADGSLPPEVEIDGLGELLEIEGRPKWRFSSSINWESGPVEVGLFGKYVGKVWDTSVSRDIPIETTDPNGNFYRVNDWFTMNFSIAYNIENDTALDGTRIRFAINNLFDKDPPLADEAYGFFSELHSARGRVFHIELRKKF